MEKKKGIQREAFPQSGRRHCKWGERPPRCPKAGAGRLRLPDDPGLLRTPQLRPPGRLPRAGVHGGGGACDVFVTDACGGGFPRVGGAACVCGTEGYIQGRTSESQVCLMWAVCQRAFKMPPDPRLPLLRGREAAKPGQQRNRTSQLAWN